MSRFGKVAGIFNFSKGNQRGLATIVLMLVLVAVASSAMAETAIYAWGRQSGTVHLDSWEYAEYAPVRGGLPEEVGQMRPYEVGAKLDRQIPGPRMFVFRSYFSINDINYDDPISFMVTASDWPYDIYVNGVRLNSAGVHGPVYRSTIYYAARVVIPPELIKRYGGINTLEIAGFPQFETSAAPLVYMGPYMDITGKVFIRNLLNINLVQAAVVVGLIIALFFAFLYFRTPVKDMRYLWVSLLCLSFSVGYSNLSFWSEAVSDVMLDKLSRIGIIATSVFLAYFAMLSSGIKDRKRLIKIAIAIPAIAVSVVEATLKDKQALQRWFNEVTSNYVLAPLLVFTLVVLVIGYVKYKDISHIVLLVAFSLTIAASAHDLYYVINRITPFAWLVSYGYLSLLVSIFFVLAIEQGEIFAKSLEASSLEKTVRQRTASLQNILDSSGQGFLSVGRDCVVERGYSQECTRIFAEEIEGKDLPELLFGKHGNQAEDLRTGLNLAFKGEAPADVVLDLQDKEIEVGAKTIGIQYRMVSDEQILCILSDITLSKKVSASTEQERRKQSLIYQALNNKAGFSGYVAEMNVLASLLDEIIKRGEQPGECERVQHLVHSIIANASFFGFEKTSALARDFEMAIEDHAVMDSEINWTERRADLNVAYSEEIQLITELMGKEWVGELSSVMIPRHKYAAIIEYIKQRIPGDTKVIPLLEHYSMIELREILARIPDEASRKAREIGKKLKPIQFVVPSIKVKREEWTVIAQAISEIVENMVIHGIEGPSQRIDLGKDQEGTIIMELAEASGAITMRFYDDGRGVDPESIEKRAKTHGLIGQDASMTKQEALAMLMEPDFMGYKDNKGLAWVKREVLARKGTIEIETMTGNGMEITIAIPMSTRSAAPRRE